MTKLNLDIYCVTNKRLPHIENTNYKLVGVGKNNFPDSYLDCSLEDSIYEKEIYYSELTFHYWYWKNKLNLNNLDWVGFCQKRRFWIKSNYSKNEININNINQHILLEPEADWKNYDSIICEPININGAKKMKMIKRGWKYILKDPKILFNKKKESILFHFNMHHGYGNLEKAIEVMHSKDKKDFLEYVKNKTYFNPHIMVISKNIILDKWFKDLFSWLEKCESIFGFENLTGYDTGRIYAYLSERYLSFWFKKYTNYKEHPWIFIDY
mgnify:FL=1